MKIQNKKVDILIEGKKEDGYTIRLAPKQQPHDFSLSADELEALYKLLKAYYEKK